jgi:protein-L-isoaspartate(D-aspartate) O-methyltransferase
VGLEEEKKRLIESMVGAGSLRSERVIRAFESVPRERFVVSEHVEQAYGDYPLPITDGQTISQPTTVAIMTEALDVLPGSRVLEIGAGSGYQAAILSHLAREVYTVERIGSLYRYARDRLKGYRNVKVFLGDGSLGLEKFAPYDRIIVTACAPGVPQPLFDQLVEGGKMVLPVGKGFFQNLLIVENLKGIMKSSNLGDFVFVPLVGEFGFEG